MASTVERDAEGEPIGLALSGGGFRSALFHVGVLRWLRRENKLGAIGSITGVSGGAIVAAHLGLNWARYTSKNEKTHRAAERELLQFMRRGVHRQILVRVPIIVLLSAILANPVSRRVWRFLYLDRMFGWVSQSRLGKKSAVVQFLYANRRVRYGSIRSSLLGYYYSKLLSMPDGRAAHLSDVPADSPEIFLTATNLNEGTITVFAKQGVVLSVSDLESKSRSGKGAPAEVLPMVQTGVIPLAFAVTASSAFPAFFPPVELRADDLQIDPRALPSTLDVTDGGVADNTGTALYRVLGRMPAYFEGPKVAPQVVISSDASLPLDYVRTSTRLLIFTALRATDILMNRVTRMQNAQMARPGPLSELTVHKVGIAEVTSSTALSPDVQRCLHNIRTDLDAFSDLECYALLTHGLEVAEQTLSSCEHLAADPEPSVASA